MQQFEEDCEQYKSEIELEEAHIDEREKKRAKAISQLEVAREKSNEEVGALKAQLRHLELLPLKNAQKL